jgi:hypothetical protein
VHGSLCAHSQARLSEGSFAGPSEPDTTGELPRPSRNAPLEFSLRVTPNRRLVTAYCLVD